MSGGYRGNERTCRQYCKKKEANASRLPSWDRWRGSLCASSVLGLNSHFCLPSRPRRLHIFFRTMKNYWLFNIFSRLLKRGHAANQKSWQVRNGRFGLHCALS
jgi:hypothetical protein